MSFDIACKAGFNEDISPILFYLVDSTLQAGKVAIADFQGSIPKSLEFLWCCLVEKWKVVTAFCSEDAFSVFPLIQREEEIESDLRIRA